jgi:hypothetical protein
MSFRPRRPAQHFKNGERINQHEMLVHHANAGLMASDDDLILTGWPLT